MFKMDLFIVSCAKHFPWLRYSLESVRRFATGFRQCLVMIPMQDMSALNEWFGSSKEGDVPVRVAFYEDWPDKGFLGHEHVILCADEHTNADFCCHVDSDCLFVEPVSPADYFVDGKPVLMHGSYEWLRNEVQANLYMWKEAAERALGFTVTQETMRRHPAVHYRKTYAKTRECIRHFTGKDPADYVRSCDNSFPQTFCEFNTLGAVAWEFFRNDYHWIDHEQLHRTGTPWPPQKLVQMWSHSPPEIPQEPVYEGRPFRCTPAELLAIAFKKFD